MKLSPTTTTIFACQWKHRRINFQHKRQIALYPIPSTRLSRNMFVTEMPPHSQLGSLRPREQGQIPQSLNLMVATMKKMTIAHEKVRFSPKNFKKAYILKFLEIIWKLFFYRLHNRWSFITSRSARPTASATSASNSASTEAVWWRCCFCCIHGSDSFFTASATPTTAPSNYATSTTTSTRTKFLNSTASDDLDRGSRSANLFTAHA